MSDSTNELSATDLILPAAVILGIPTIIGVTWVLSGGNIPLSALVVLAGVYVLALSWSTMSILNARSAASTSMATRPPANMVTADSLRVMQSWPALELVPSIAAQRAARSVEVTAAVGICPRGFKEGDRITVERDGTLSPPICRTAVAALIPALEAGEEGSNGAVCQVSCLCPLAMRHLTFSIGREQLAALN